MKKQIICGVALLSLLAAGCSNEDVMNNDNEITTGKAIAIQANIANGTRMSYNEDTKNKVLKFNWSDSESFNLYQGTLGTATVFSKSTQGNIFTGVVPTGGAGAYYAVYGENITNTVGVLSIDIANQIGNASTDNGITTFMLAQATNLKQSAELFPLLDFKHKLTVLKLSLGLPSDVTGTIRKISISGLHTKAKYTLSTNTYAYDDANKSDISATNDAKGFTIADNKITAYIAVFPETVAAKQVTITALVGNISYYYNIADARTLAEGEVVPVSVYLSKNEDVVEFIKDDFNYWNENDSKDAPTNEQIGMYLCAGIYWDDGSTTGDEYYNGNVQTYKANGTEYHSGLWMKKKEYIYGFDNVSARSDNHVSANENSDCWHIGRPAANVISQYFFLPAAGYYRSYWYDLGTNGNYWSSTPDGTSKAYELSFSSTGASVGTDSKSYKKRLFMYGE